jgi:hypothetical protein
VSARSAITDPNTDQATLANPAYTDLLWMSADMAGKVTWIHVYEGSSLSIMLKNTGANSIDYAIYGSNDPTFAVADCDNVVASASVASGASVFFKKLQPEYLYYKVQIRDTVNGNHGAVRGRAAMKDTY